jgi:hypothetical protein
MPTINYHRWQPTWDQVDQEELVIYDPEKKQYKRFRLRPSGDLSYKVGARSTSKCQNKADSLIPYTSV